MGTLGPTLPRYEGSTVHTLERRYIPNASIRNSASRSTYMSSCVMSYKIIVTRRIYKILLEEESSEGWVVLY